ncbi:MAG TPA: poly-beta-1,6-N-acetyl-D-glucosamine biosynthesis protein PgaD [Alphaproteobacteria bacterium]|nr:poly-beta-1,6-N-acetyl-D-glucosamine biosynthesis protein PgaD [Alphaproteobacteria bacterium]
MSGEMRPPWPPIITDAKEPRLIVWRDRLLTVGMWILFLYLLRHGIHVVLDIITDLFGHDLGAPDLNWALWWSRLQPYLVVAIVLGLWLLAWGFVALKRARQNITKPQPPPLTLAEEARHAGSSEADLLAWRKLPTAIVELDERGRPSVRAGSQSASESVRAN